MRGKAIRLVANKLFPLPMLAPAVETFAREALRRAVPLQRAADGAEAETETETEVRDRHFADDSRHKRRTDRLTRDIT